MSQGTAIAGIILLFFIIIFCTIKKTNPGILGIACSFILGWFIYNETGVPLARRATEILAGFPVLVFTRLVMISILFAIARQNGTMKRITYAALGLVRGNLKLVPVVLWLLLSIVGWFGAAGIPWLMLVMMLTAEICEETGLDYFKVSATVYVGQLLSIDSKVGVMGLVGQSYAGQFGLDIGDMFAHTALLWYIPLFIGTYFVMGCHKFAGKADLEKLGGEKMTTENIITLIVIAIYGVLSVGVGPIRAMEVYLLAATAAAILIYLFKYDEKELISMVPWPIMIMIIGMGMFVATFQAAGSVDLISNTLNNMINERSANVLFSLVGTILSAVSDGPGVVTPATIPIAVGLAESNGLNAVKLCVACLIGMNPTSFTPLSTGGATVMACATGYKGRETELYAKQFKCAIIWAVVHTIAAALNIYIN